MDAVQALDDAMVGAHLGVFNPGDDARAALDKIINWHVMVALDPAVSSSARALLKANIDCRTCKHFTTGSSGCISVVKCVDAQQYRPTYLRQYWREHD